MKNHLLSSVIDNLCNSAYLKLFMGLSWLSIIGAAGYFDILFEVYLLSMFIAIGAYLICNRSGSKGSQEVINTSTQANYNPPKENYLGVFMPVSQKE